MSVLTITKENFNREVMESQVPVLLDFWAPWCGPCKMVSPIIDEVARDASGFKVGKVNIDEQPDLAQAFNVMSIPTLAVVNEGKLIRSSVGAKPKNAILSMLKNL